MKSLYAEVDIEIENDSEHYHVFDNVTGQLVGSFAKLSEAQSLVDIINKHYSGLAHQAGWVR